MAGKPIIINGIDVSKCEKYEHEIIRCNATIKNMCYCGGRCTDKKNADCYFKQLKRKEQECEELKNFHINLVGVKECDIRELLKLKQTLTEIKEIAEDFYLDGEHVKDKYLAQEILQKISECELKR